jgi:hypothetical protein
VTRVPEKKAIFQSVIVYYKTLSFLYSLPAQIEQVQDKMHRLVITTFSALNAESLMTSLEVGSFCALSSIKAGVMDFVVLY